MEIFGRGRRAFAGAGLRVAVVVALCGGALAHMAVVAPAALADGPTPVATQGPALTLTPFVPLEGIFPSATVDSGGAPLGVVRTMAGTFAPGASAAADGQPLSTVTYPSAYEALGTTFGGDGIATFDVPDLRGRTAVGTGSGAGLSTVALGDKIGANTATITRDELPVSYGGAGALFTRRQPALGLSYLIRVEGDFPLESHVDFDSMGVVVPYAGTVVPAGWMPADGQLLSTTTYNVLFQILGTTYGGDGVNTFALPDLRGRAPVEAGGCAPGLSCRVLGEQGGEESVSLTTSQLPVGVGGRGVSFDNNSPSLALTYLCKTVGLYPPQPDTGAIDPVEPFVGEVMLYAGYSNTVDDPTCSGQLLSITQSAALFSILGTTFGGDGETSFALPDLRSRAAVGNGCGPGLDCVSTGEPLGGETTTLLAANLPAPLVPGAPTAPTGVPASGRVTLSWSAPVSNGGSPVTGYVVTPSIGPVAQTPVAFPGNTATTETINALTNGTPYTFTVAAINAVGTGPASTASGVVTPTVTPPVLARIDGAGNAWVKVGSLANPWTEVATGVSAVAVASDATHGVLIGIINTNGFYAKYGVAGTWTHELAAGATAISVATDPVNGAVLGVVNPNGAYVKQGLTGAWSHEIGAGATAVSVATDATNGAFIGVVNPAGVYAKKGLTGTWNHEIAAGATAVSVATDATNGALIGVLYTTGFYAKQGLTGAWNHESAAGTTAISVATDQDSGPLIGANLAAGFLVKTALTNSWITAAPAGQTAIAVAG